MTLTTDIGFKPIINQKTLIDIYGVILSNSGIPNVVNTINGRKTLLAITDDEGLFITAYQSLFLATPICYDTEPYDGERFTVSFHGQHVCDVMLSTATGGSQ